FRRFSRYRSGNWRVMEQHDSFFGAQAIQSHLEPERFIHCFSDEVFDRILAKRRQHVFIKTAAEALGARKSDIFQLKRFGLLEHHHLGRPQYFLDLFWMPALIIVIAKYGNDRNAAGTQIFRKLMSFLRQPKVREVST